MKRLLKENWGMLVFIFVAYAAYGVLLHAMSQGGSR